MDELTEVLSQKSGALAVNPLEVYKLLLHIEKTINRRSPKLARVSTTQDVAWSQETT